MSRQYIENHKYWAQMQMMCQMLLCAKFLVVVVDIVDLNMHSQNLIRQGSVLLFFFFLFTILVNWTVCWKCWWHFYPLPGRYLESRGHPLHAGVWSAPFPGSQWQRDPHYDHGLQIHCTCPCLQRLQRVSHCLNLCLSPVQIISGISCSLKVVIFPLGYWDTMALWSLLLYIHYL